jgi:predicted transcriptional regulator
VQSSVDTAVEAPYAGFMNLQVPPELEAKLTRLAAETGRTVDEVALELLATSMDHDEWFRAEVEKGRVAAREGRLLEHDDVAARLDRRYRGRFASAGRRMRPTISNASATTSRRVVQVPLGTSPRPSFAVSPI